MKRILNKPIRDEKGQALILVLILLLLVSLIMPPLLSFMSTGLIIQRKQEQRTLELYAADAGVEDALYNIITPTAPYYTDLQNLAENEVSDPYTLTNINGLSVSYTVKKLYLVEGLLDEGEYPNGATPNVDNIELEVFEAQKTYGTDADGDFVEYPSEITFEYTGGGNRRIQSIGIFFAPLPNNDADLVRSPDEIVYTLEMTEDNLESIETRIASGGFAFIWTWEKNDGPLFDSGDTGTISFTFKIYEPAWVDKVSFIWALVKENDIAYITNADFSRWLIEATAGDTEVRSVALAHSGLYIITWEISTQ